MTAGIVRRVLRVAPPGLKRRAVDVLAGLGMVPSMLASLRLLSDLGFRPNGIVDVGAYRGEWTRAALEIWPGARSLMIEARSSERPELEKTVGQVGGRAMFRTVLVGAKAREAVEFFELDQGGTGSSVLEELTDVPRRKVVLPMHTLDEVVRQEAGLPTPVDLLKLDVQGFELEVLEGARQLLGGCAAIVTEVSLLPYNRGAPLFAEMIRYLDERDFVLFDIATIMRDRRRRILQLDAVFVRRGSGLRGGEASPGPGDGAGAR